MIWWREKRSSSVSLKVSARSSSSLATSRSRPSDFSFFPPSAFALSILPARRRGRPGRPPPPSARRRGRTPPPRPPSGRAVPGQEGDLLRAARLQGHDDGRGPHRLQGAGRRDLAHEAAGRAPRTWPRASGSIERTRPAPSEGQERSAPATASDRAAAERRGRGALSSGRSRRARPGCRVRRQRRGRRGCTRSPSREARDDLDLACGCCGRASPAPRSSPGRAAPTRPARRRAGRPPRGGRAGGPGCAPSRSRRGSAWPGA